MNRGQVHIIGIWKTFGRCKACKVQRFIAYIYTHLFKFTTERCKAVVLCRCLTYVASNAAWNVARNDVDCDDVTINNVTFSRKMDFFCDPQIVKNVFFRMNIASRKQVQCDFYAYILDSNMFIYFKFDTVDNIWRNSDLWK